MIRHEVDSPVCAECELKLIQAHPECAVFFHAVKAKYPHIHISWTFRDKPDQDRACAAGLSNTPWPTSYHNKTDKDSKPCSHAIDVFLITPEEPDGIFDRVLVEFCREIYNEFKADFPWCTWGGNFKHPDSDHFQIEVDEIPLDPPND